MRKQRRIWLFKHIPHFIQCWLSYLFTNDCKHICGNTIFRDYVTGNQVTLFIPECGCPVHDTHEWFR